MDSAQLEEASGLQLNNFDTKAFLKSFWQQKPLLISQGIANLDIDFDQNDLAGMALEENIDSRIIKEPSTGQYELMSGPFLEDDFQKLDNTEPWTLLVQSVDHFVPDVSAIKQYFSFIPAWRLDDIMVSYATNGGSVGPHFDYYDVFLVQLQGKRLWKIGQHCDDKTPLQDHQDLKLLETFEQQTEYMLDVGDILYVPPGVAHWGIAATDDCMTISVGFRAPSYTDLMMNVGDDVLLTVPQNLRYCDKNLSTQNTQTSHYEIAPDVLTQIQSELMTLALDEKRIAKVFGKLMTEPNYIDASENVTASEAKKISQKKLFKHLDSRMAYTKTSKYLMLFANGKAIELPLSHELFVKSLCAQDFLNLEEVTEEQLEVVGSLINLNIYDLGH